MNIIKKAIFPVAGIGSRFLPATKATPKEMLPIVDKPLIQYAVEEAITAGITELIFITNYSKRTIEDHFDKNLELERLLEQAGKLEVLAKVKKVTPPKVTFVYIRQMQPLGLGHAILCAKSVIGTDPFAVLLADDLIITNKHAQNSCLQQMIDKYNQVQSSIIAVEACDPEMAFHYGIVGVVKDFKDFGKINNIVEKPKPPNAPSNLAVIGRYILSANIFTELENFQKLFNQTIDQELQLTPAIFALLKKENVYALKLDGLRFDCGQKLGYLKAIVTMALQQPNISQDFKNFLINTINNN